VLSQKKFSPGKVCFASTDLPEKFISKVRQLDLQWWIHDELNATGENKGDEANCDPNEKDNKILVGEILNGERWQCVPIGPVEDWHNLTTMENQDDSLKWILHVQFDKNPSYSSGCGTCSTCFENHGIFDHVTNLPPHFRFNP